jgi:hypothetical protein
VVAGSEFKLECSFSGSPQPDVEWFKDGGPLEENDRVTCTVNDDVTSLVIKRTEADDEGWYRCRISNEKGATAIEAELIVVETPTFVTELEDVTIDEGMKRLDPRKRLTSLLSKATLFTMFFSLFNLLTPNVLPIIFPSL